MNDYAQDVFTDEVSYGVQPVDHCMILLVNLVIYLSTYDTHIWISIYYHVVRGSAVVNAVAFSHVSGGTQVQATPPPTISVKTFFTRPPGRESPGTGPTPDKVGSLRGELSTSSRPQITRARVTGWL